MASDAAQAVAPSPTEWWVQVRGRAFGPYTFAQLTEFAKEGRIRPSTPISFDPNTGWKEARRIEGLMPQFAHAAPDTPGGAPAPAAAPEAANVFVHAEIVSGGWTPFMAALTSMGAICELAPGFWLVRTRFSAGVVRNMLSQTLERGDRFIVIDATRDRLAWFNLGPENDAKIREVWNGPLRDPKKR